MNRVTLTSAISALAVCLPLSATTATAQVRGRPVRGPIVGRAVSRGFGPRVFAGGRPIFVSPRVVGVIPYRPYFYPYRPGISIGFYAGFGYPSYYGYPYPVYGYPYGAYPYGPYPYGGYPYGGYSYGGYPYAASPSPYGAYQNGGYYGANSGYPLPPPGYVSMRPGAAYGGVKIEGAPRGAQVFADGYYVGIVDDFDGPLQHLNLEAGRHQIEIRVSGQQPIAFEVNVQAGQTITYHADVQ